MDKVFVVARREYNAAVRTKAFLISLFLMPLMFGGGAVVQFLLRNQVDTETKNFALVDRTPGEQLATLLQAAVADRNAAEIVDRETGRQTRPAFLIETVNPVDAAGDDAESQRLALSDRVRRGEIFGFLEIGPHVIDAAAAPAEENAAAEAADARSLRYQSNSPTYDDFRQWAAPIIERAVREKRIQAAGLPSEAVRAAWQPVPLLVKGLSQRDVQSGTIQAGKDENAAVSIIAPAALMILMFMLILVGGTPGMQGVVEEKMQRIAEMMLGSIGPFQLMMGKLLGLMGVSLTLAVLYLGGAYWAAEHFGVAHVVSPAILAWFAVYLVVALLMYGALFIAVGAACSDIRDTQTMLWPVMLLAMVPLFVWINVAKEPTSSFSTAISLVPTATPMLMMIRIAVPPGVGLWQPLLGLGLMLITTVACVYVAGRIFRVGILMQGKGASVREVARWIVRG